MAFFLRYYNKLSIDDAFSKLKNFRYSPEFKKELKNIYGIDIRCRINKSQNLIVGDIALKKKIAIVKTEVNTGLIENKDDSVSFYEEKIDISERSYFGISFKKEKLIFLNSKDNYINITKIFSKIFFDEFDKIDNLQFDSMGIIKAFKENDGDISKIWSISLRKDANKKTNKDKEYTYKVSSSKRLIEIISELDKDEFIDGVGIFINFLDKETSLSVYDHGSLNLHTSIVKDITDKREKYDKKYLLNLDYNNLFTFFNMLYQLFKRLQKYTILKSGAKTENNFKSIHKTTIKDFLDICSTDIFSDINPEYNKYFDTDTIIIQLIEAKKELLDLISKKEAKESKYQDFFKKYPFCFSLYYNKIESHNKLDDKNIPDFTGVRVKDNFHDIFEIKQPFKCYFNKNNSTNPEYSKDLKQCKDYLKYCENHKQTLREEKNILIQEPKCYFVTTYNLSEFYKNKLKEDYKDSNLKIELITYDEILKQIDHIINSINMVEEVEVII